MSLTRRQMIRISGLALGGILLNQIGLNRRIRPWQRLLPLYEISTRKNIVISNNRRALHSAAVYPGTYVRDALFWGPLALNDLALGYECYQWFAETQMDSGQIRSAVPLHPGEVDLLDPKDDEGTLLFIIASDWLRRAGYTLDLARIEAAYEWVQTHVVDDMYVSPPGPFRYWADTVRPDTDDVLSHNQGLLCLARFTMQRMKLGGATGDGVERAIRRYAAFDTGNYVRLGIDSQFRDVIDNSAVFPVFLARYLYSWSLLDDDVVLRHMYHLINHATVYDWRGRPAGIKIICGPDGAHLPPEWFFEPGLNSAGDYHNGGYWPMYTLVGLAMVYRINNDPALSRLIGQLVQRELGADPRSKEMMPLSEGHIGAFDENRTDYTWNALIPTALRWAGLT